MICNFKRPLTTRVLSVLASAFITASLFTAVVVGMTSGVEPGLAQAGTPAGDHRHRDRLIDPNAHAPALRQLATGDESRLLSLT